MDEATHKAWWPLHLRAAKGELLTEAEQIVYETGTQQLDAEEHLEFDMAGLQRTREQIRQMEAERLELEARRQQLQARIAQIEGAMSARDKQTLGIGI